MKYVNVTMNTPYFETSEISDVIEEINKKIPLWVSGLETPSKCEKFVYAVLKDNWRGNLFDKNLKYDEERTSQDSKASKT